MDFIQCKTLNKYLELVKRVLARRALCSVSPIPDLPQTLCGLMYIFATMNVVP